MLNGRYSQRSGFYAGEDSRFGLDIAEVTIADELKALGYRTGMFGKAGYHRLYRPQKSRI